MKSEVRRSDFHAFGFYSFKKNSELSPTTKKKKKENCEQRSKKKA